jgi:DNA-binding transcriptional LysR family regulator
MDQQSLQDLLALIDVRNVSLAARQQNVSQSAYSRRLQSIEQRYGITLFDRSRRPARPSPMLDAMRTDIEAALNTLKRMEKRLSSGIPVEGSLTIAAMHSLSTGVLPVALKHLAPELRHRGVRLRSANRDGCFQLLMTGEVSLMVSYETDALPLNAPPHLVATTQLCRDPFIPVCSPHIAADLQGDTTGAVAGQHPIPLLAYPPEVFLGRVMNHEILARSERAFTHQLTAGMTSVLHSAAIAGIGLAWLPASITGDAIASGRLVQIEARGCPTLDLNVSMLRLRTPGTPELNALCESLGVAISRTFRNLQQEKICGS